MVKEAARRRCTMSEIAETALRLLLQADKQEYDALPSLPKFKSGGPLVDIADRNALYEAVEGC